MHRGAIAIVAATLAMSATAVCAQTDATYLLVSRDTVGPTTPTTTIEVWAMWNNPAEPHRLYGVTYDLVAGEGQFSNGVNVLNGPLSTVGVIAGKVVSGAFNSQAIICGSVPCSYDNPILLATYDWTTSDFTPRSVGLLTSNTNRFAVAKDLPFGAPIVVDLYPNEFTPGLGIINVVPAPSTLLVLALPLAAIRRRRRC